MLTAFGSVAVSIMFASYWLEPRSRWFVLVFAASVHQVWLLSDFPGCAGTNRLSRRVPLLKPVLRMADSGGDPQWEEERWPGNASITGSR